MREFKSKVYLECYKTLSERILSIEKALESLKEDVQNESKSSSGDKHETARAMIHIEQEQLNNQLREFNNQALILKRIQPFTSAKMVSPGSLVETTDNLYFISIPIGKLIINDKIVYCISPASPVGVMLYGKRSTENFILNNKNISILNIY